MTTWRDRILATLRRGAPAGGADSTAQPAGSEPPSDLDGELEDSFPASDPPSHW
jgi:hypothetical protein